MLVSTFELLLKPQLPKIDGLSKELTEKLKGLSRTILQGYFLTIANPNKYEVEVTLTFTSVDTTNLLDKTLTFFDATDVNEGGKLTNGTTTLKIIAGDTGLFLLQPNIIDDDGALLKSAEGFEVRGYVEISLTKPTPSEDTALLLTAEHRGTFFRNTDMLISKGLTAYAQESDLELDQIAYQLPMASGGSKFTFLS